MTILTSRIFMNGNSQAVRIPREFRLDSPQVEITRTESGDLVIHPLPTDRGAALLEALSGFDDDFVAALEAGRDEPLVTNNTREFERVTGLRLENWAG